MFSDIFGETFLTFMNALYVNVIETLYITYNEYMGYDTENSKYWKDKAYVDRQELDNIDYKIKKMNEFKTLNE